MSSARYCPTSRAAALATGLAVLLTACGSVSAPHQSGGGARRLPPASVIYVVAAPGLIPIGLAHHTVGRPIPLPADGLGVAVTSDRRTAYTIVGASVVPVDLTTGARGRPIAAPRGSSFIVLADDGHTAYVVDGSAIVSIRLPAGRSGPPVVFPQLAIDSLVVAAGGHAACVTGATITASGVGEHQVIERVDLSTGRTGKRIVIPGLLGAAITPDGRIAYAASGNALVRVDLATGKTGRPIRTPMLGIGAIAITSDGRTAYLGNLKPASTLAGVVVPVNLVTGTAQTAIHVPSYPYSITDIVIAPDGRTAYAAAYSSVIPINLTTRKPGSPIPMPHGIAAIELAP